MASTASVSLPLPPTAAASLPTVCNSSPTSAAFFCRPTPCISSTSASLPSATTSGGGTITTSASQCSGDQARCFLKVVLKGARHNKLRCSKAKEGFGADSCVGVAAQQKRLRACFVSRRTPP